MPYDIGREIIAPEAKKLFADLKRVWAKLGNDARAGAKEAVARRVRHVLAQIESSLPPEVPTKTTVTVVDVDEEPKP